MDNLQQALWEQIQDSTLQMAFVLGGLLLLGRFRQARPTRLTLILVFAPAAILLLGFLWRPVQLLYHVYMPVLILLLMVDGFLLSVPARAISLRRDLNPRFSIGQNNPVQLALMNNSGQSVRGVVRDGIPAGLLAPGEGPGVYDRPVTLTPYDLQTVAYELYPLRRGRFEFGRIHFRYRSRLGLLWLCVAGGRRETVKVWPDLRRLRRLRVQASRAINVGELRRRSLGVEGTQFSGLRHYFSGDDVRRMAWQATAKLDMPVIRTFEHEVEQPVMVLLDAGRKMTGESDRLRKYDRALNAALAFMAVAIDRGDSVGVGVFASRMLAQVPLGQGAGHFSRILETLSETEPQPLEPDYESVLLQVARGLKRRGLVVILTDLSDPMAARSLLRGLHSFAANHLLMVVTLADREAERLAGAEAPDTAYGVYRKGVAMDLMALRRRTLAELSRANHALVVDGTPETLDERLIQQYLALKQRSRL